MESGKALVFGCNLKLRWKIFLELGVRRRYDLSPEQRSRSLPGAVYEKQNVISRAVSR